MINECMRKTNTEQGHKNKRGSWSRSYGYLKLGYYNLSGMKLISLWLLEEHAVNNKF